MPIDLQLLRKDQGGNPDLVEESQRRRFKDVQIISAIQELDRDCRQQVKQVDNINKEMRLLSKAVGEIMKKVSELPLFACRQRGGGKKYSKKKKKKKEKTEKRSLSAKELEEVEKLKQKKLELEEGQKKLEKELEENISKRNKLLQQIGNIVHDSVPVSRDEKDNKLIRQWGAKPMKTGKERHHHELLWMCVLLIQERGRKGMKE
ncbi:hypothetical protein RFI_07961 [Reticulomyxa filosa]|uniref:Serine-tRNA synthetase type1 N-terminal domain-containing protein n=1 Tax=Reticulomyxa filosa TaxID=46433 RepID=X6NSA1_RETFI|nr:hypothetical protein RFI_07961 [Reticulomyxa filosa]|eukprot:ETO29165.1 hypothetical protein RFI_07961 [Reticulomyxa filosa]